MEEYYMGSGGWYKTIGGDGPYAKDGNDYILIGSGGGSGAPVDVLGTVVTTLSADTEKPKDGDTVQKIFDKLTTFNKDFPTEVRDVSLLGLSFNNTSIANGDTINTASGKLQGQINNINSNIPLPTDISTIALQTKLTGLRELPAEDITTNDDIINAFGKLLGTVKMLQSRIQQLEGAKSDAS